MPIPSLITAKHHANLLNVGCTNQTTTNRPSSPLNIFAKTRFPLQIGGSVYTGLVLVICGIKADLHEKREECQQTVQVLTLKIFALNMRSNKERSEVVVFSFYDILLTHKYIRNSDNISCPRGIN